MRQIILDTETTGLEVQQGHRIIEVGAIEVLNRRATGRTFHKYICPDRAVDPGALKVHGITNDFLNTQPRFQQIAAELIEFITGAELVIHNASFDVAFLNAEFARLPGELCTIATLCTVVDTLPLARKLHPGQRNSLDALCKRYHVDHSRRELHGALLDAQLLLDVYLAMTGGQVSLTLGEPPPVATAQSERQLTVSTPVQPLRVVYATTVELQAHEQMLATIDKVSAGKTLWRTVQERSGV